MNYNELYQRYKMLLKENKKLKEEISLYHQEYGLIFDSENNRINIDSNKNHQENVEEQNSNELNIVSSPDKKIDVFKSLFQGREDVYAHRWKSKNGNTGYSPVCINEWVQGLCEKPKVKCLNCKHRKFDKLTETVIRNHLLGKEIIGVYPLLKDETCKFLAIDFDKGTWQDDVSILRQISSEKDIPLYIERSRSGNGAHVWFFFAEKISASLARKFGTAIITYAMEKRHEIKFESYDRLFPNQDTRPKGGLGNLISLPLQKLARKDGNSLFVDENFVAYEDQWKFLSDIQKIKKSEVEKYILELTTGNELGNFGTGKDEKPWEKKSIQTVMSFSDYPSSVFIVKADMLYIEKEGLSQKLMNEIKRLGAFPNPEFYKAQAMRLPTYNKPRIISLSEETDQYLCLPRGCEKELNILFKKGNTEIDLIDKRNEGMKIDVSFNGQLRPTQVEAVGELLKYETGILSATTAFGKTVVGANIISEKKVNTLIVVHTRQLVQQWRDTVKKILMINENLAHKNNNSDKKDFDIIGQIGGGKSKQKQIVDIALIQSLVRKGEVKDLVKDYGMVIIDECHHAASFSYEKLLKTVSARYVYGLTATPIRKDGHHPIIFMCLGDIRYRQSPKKKAAERPFDHFVIPRISPVKMLVTEKRIKYNSIQEVFSYIANNQIRNKLISEDILKNINEGRNIIALTERTAHVQKLYDLLKNKIKNIFVLTGSLTAKERKETEEKLKNIPVSENILIIATGKYIGEGFDYPRLDTLFLTFPISWKGRLQQYAGRLHRLYEEKKEVYIYDYVDIHIKVLERMYQKRLKGYATIGYKVKSDLKEKDNISVIFDNTNFLTTFSTDIAAANKQIFIVSPYINKRKTSDMLKLLAGASNNNVKVTIITRPVDDFKNEQRKSVLKIYDMIQSEGVELKFKEQLYQKFAAIDNQLVWYGDISLLSYGKSQESIMRLNSLEVANELLGSIK